MTEVNYAALEQSVKKVKIEMGCWYWVQDAHDGEETIAQPLNVGGEKMWAHLCGGYDDFAQLLPLQKIVKLEVCWE